MNRAEKQTIKAHLTAEDKTLKDLETAYKKAKKDTQERLKQLNSRTDMQNLQSIIYQKRYQQQLMKQINGVLDDLQTHTYRSATEFFEGSYKDGYIGSMYELQSKGIPLTVPVSPQKMRTAIQTDSKLSKTYYEGQGLSVQNIRTLKKQIALEATRGIASGKSWLETAESLTIQKCFQISQSDAMRIIRTEGNRINQQGRLDAGNDAVDAGCDLLKQWDATLDSRTREAHREADGQIVEWSEEFTVGGEKMVAPSIGGSASNVCNCRCQLLKRPRWALDDEELETLKKRAEYYGLDKSDSFEDYKKKYLQLPPNAQNTPSPQVLNAIPDLDQTAKKFANSMSPEEWNEFRELIKQNPDIARCYGHCDDLNRIIYKKGNGCFWDSTRNIEYSFPLQKYIDTGMSKFETAAHEYMHYVDTFARDPTKCDVSKLTWNEIDGIKDAVGEMFTRNMTKHGLSNSDQYLDALRKDFENIANNLGDFKRDCMSNRNTSAGAQDACDGWGLGRIYWGHGDKYYNRKYNNLKQWEKQTGFTPTKDLQNYYKSIGLDASNQAKTKNLCRQYESASEHWANVGSAKTTGGKEKDFNDKWFPESSKMMDEILKGVK